MHESVALKAMEGHRAPSDAVYSLTRRKKRSFAREFLDVVVTEGLFGSTKDLAENMSAPFYLIASESKGTIVRLQDGAVIDTLNVTPWRSADKEKFKVVGINGHEYRKVARIA